MKDKHEAGLAIKELSNLMRRATFGCKRPENNVTMMQGWVIEYLCRKSEEDVFQKDIESRFGIRRSTATTILKLMEKDGLIERSKVDYDARLKKICVTEKAKKINEYVYSRIVETEKIMLRGISESELEIFFTITDKMKNNLLSISRSE
ncbi:MarR family transcriptional regulator [Lachnospiraceae bacterium NSJ-143]|nr:MarR family transcriptional regulator [Lachnospiraceae bacterium NSJ-143]